MGIHLSDGVEIIVGKGEIARYEQFLLFPQLFQSCLVLMCQNEYLWSKGLKDLVAKYKPAQTINESKVVR